jgi:hypothetical protein
MTGSGLLLVVIVDQDIFVCIFALLIVILIVAA